MILHTLFPTLDHSVQPLISKTAKHNAPPKGPQTPLPTDAQGRTITYWIWHLTRTITSALGGLIERCRRCISDLGAFWPNGNGSERGRAGELSVASPRLLVPDGEFPQRGDALIRRIASLASIWLVSDSTSLQPVGRLPLPPFPNISIFLNPALASVEPDRSPLPAELNDIPVWLQLYLATAGVEAARLCRCLSQSVEFWSAHTHLRSRHLRDLFLPSLMEALNASDVFGRIQAIEMFERCVGALYQLDGSALFGNLAKSSGQLGELLERARAFEVRLGPSLDSLYSRVLKRFISHSAKALWLKCERGIHPLISDRADRSTAPHRAGNLPLDLSWQEGWEIAKVFSLQGLCILAAPDPTTPHALWLNLLSWMYCLLLESYYALMRNQLVEEGAMQHSLSQSNGVLNSIKSALQPWDQICFLVALSIVHYIHRLSVSDLGQKIGWGLFGGLAGLALVSPGQTAVSHLVGCQLEHWSCYCLGEIMAGLPYLLIPILARLAAIHRHTSIEVIAQFLQIAPSCDRRRGGERCDGKAVTNSTLILELDEPRNEVGKPRPQ